MKFIDFFSVIVSPVVVERIYLGFGLTPILHIFIWPVICVVCIMLTIRSHFRSTVQIESVHSIDMRDEKAANRSQLISRC
jgi:hypothetical protein